MGIRSTKQVAKLLGVRVGKLSRLVWLEQITPPERGPGNSFLWTDADINRASKEIFGRVYTPLCDATPSKPRQLAQGIANVR